jgi:hypothetical protein
MKFKVKPKLYSGRIERAVEWNSHLAVSEYTTRRLTFGQHAGVMIKDLPIDYLEWGILNLDRHWSDTFIREWKRRNPNWRSMKT